MLGPTLLRVVGQQCCVRLHGPLNLLFLSIVSENGADLTAVNNEGQSALSLAVAVGNKHGWCFPSVSLV